MKNIPASVAQRIVVMGKRAWRKMENIRASAAAVNAVRMNDASSQPAERHFAFADGKDAAVPRNALKRMAN